MAGPGRPPRSIQDLNAQISIGGEIAEPELMEPPKKRIQKDTDAYRFEMVGNFPKDQQSGTIRYPGLSLGNSQVVFDEEKGVQRNARLLRGIDTIWVDEQKDLEPKFVARNKPTLTFNNGQLIIPVAQANTIKYLLLCSDFEGCTRPAINRRPRYRLVNTEAEEAVKLEAKKKVKDASDKAWGTSIENLIPHAKYLGISMINDKGLSKSDEALIHDYVNKAEAQPDLFLRTYNNPKVKMYGLVKKAFEQSMIVYVDGQAIWSDTKAVICQVPEGKNPPDYLAELMLTKDGLELRSRLENI